jgi:two-component system, chemotaxis family, chemotaxis protein CheY
MPKILIVDNDTIGSRKLKLVLSKYGECDIVQSGKEALEKVKSSHTASAPYGYITIEMDLEDMTGPEILEQIRNLEAQQRIEPSKISQIILIVSKEDWEETETLVQSQKTEMLPTPYNRKMLEDVLEKIGLQKLPPEEVKNSFSSPSPTPKSKPAAPKAPPAPKIDPKIVEMVLKKITAFIQNAEQFKGVNAPQILADLVKRGGADAERLIAQYMSTDKVPVETRLELVRSAAIIKSPFFMIPLNKILNAEDNIKMIQEAIYAIGKYENQRALNLLNQALQKFKNPMLLNAIRTELHKIKSNKPILAILPRFLKSYNHPKNFAVTVDILKKIVSPEDTDLFLNYLKSGNTVLEDGTFEILCHSADGTVKTTIFNYFEDRIQKIPCLKESDCYDLYMMMSHLFTYLKNNPSLIDEQVHELTEFYGTTKDIRVKQIIITIMSNSSRSEALEFIKTTYNQEKDLQEHIIEQLSGKQQAVDFLFEKYHQGQALKEKVITSLLKSEQGLQYFIKHFFTFELDKQEIIIRNITFSEKEYLVDFIQKVYESDLYSLKFHLLKILKKNYLFSFKNILFDEKNQREFMFMGKDYLLTIMELFPITSLKMFYERIAYDDLSNSKVKKFLAAISAISASEPVLYFNNAKFINKLFNRALIANNIELNVLFFASFENIKIFDLKSYKFLLDATNAFIEARGENINQKEKGPISRLKTKLREQLPDIRDIENLRKDLATVFTNQPIELPHLEKILESNHKSVALKIHHVIAYLARQLKNPNYIKEDELQLFNVKFPTIAEFIKFQQNHQFLNEQENWLDNSQKLPFLKNFKDTMRVVIVFKEKRKSAFLKDQLEEMFPEFQILVDREKLQERDFLICDTESLKNFIEKKTLSTNRIYLYLENRADFVHFRSYNPKVFMKPFSGHRVVRMLLQEMYLNK